MPNKKYVSDADLSLYNQAQESEDGNLYATITRTASSHIDQEFNYPDDFETAFHDVMVRGGKYCRL